MFAMCLIVGCMGGLIGLGVILEKIVHYRLMHRGQSINDRAQQAEACPDRDALRTAKPEPPSFK